MRQNLRSRIQSGVLLIVATAAGQACLAQSAIFSNGSSDPLTPALGTGTTTSSGAQAPAGAQWSETAQVSATESNAVIGFSTHAYSGGAYRFADDFTVPAGRVWRLDAADFFAYQTGAPLPPGASPFSGLSVRIWSGVPGAPGSEVLFGDGSANRLVSSVGGGYYRVMNSAVLPLGGLPDASRLIWRSEAALDGVVLGPGTYWIDWQYSVAPGASAFSPPVTKPGVRTQAGWNALQLKPSGVWAAVIDGGKPEAAADAPQDMPFILLGVDACATDFNLDGASDPDDLADVIAAFFAVPPDPRADINGDGVVDPDDLADYIAAYFGGAC